VFISMGKLPSDSDTGKARRGIDLIEDGSRGSV
jgi:hypothetical protein